jgi:hypothetical protein
LEWSIAPFWRKVDVTPTAWTSSTTVKRNGNEGLELSVVAIVDVEQNTGYTLSAQQTESGLSTQTTPLSREFDDQGQPYRVLSGASGLLHDVFPGVDSYVVADGFYSKYKWVTGVVQLGFMRLVNSAVMPTSSFSMTGPYRVEAHPDAMTARSICKTTVVSVRERLEDGVYLYTAVVWSVSLKRKVRLAYLLKEHQGRRSYVVLFSTDLDIDPVFLYRCYSARFQIEFVFRDARQFTGLADVRLAPPRRLIPMSMPV